MNEPSEQSRREFLTGRGAARALSDKLRHWADIHLSPFTGEAAVTVQATRRAMACDFEVQYHAADAYAADAVMDALDLVEALEEQLTIYRDYSEVIEINAHAADGPVEVEAQLFSLLEQADRISRATGGAFDITSTPLSRVWGFLRREGRRPTDEEISAARERVGFDGVQLNATGRTVRFLRPGLEINLNAIGKGYALDRVAQLLDERQVSDFLWHGGRSSVLARGRNRSDARGAWTIGLPHPLEPGRRLAEFYLRDRALGTSGGGTQFFEHEGQRYGHLIDPCTGWPSPDVYTATAIAPSAAEADALATAFYVMGPAGVSEYCATHHGVSAVLVCPAEGDQSITLHAWGLESTDWQRF